MISYKVDDGGAFARRGKRATLVEGHPQYGYASPRDAILAYLRGIDEEIAVLNVGLQNCQARKAEGLVLLGEQVAKEETT